MENPGQKPIETITISKWRYNELIASEKLLDALYDAGVDNWEWYETALDNLEE